MFTINHYALETRAVTCDGIEEETKGGVSNKKTARTSACWNQRYRAGMLLNCIIFKLWPVH